MVDVINKTVVTHQVIQGRDEHANELTTLLMKATFDIFPKLALSQEQLPVCEADEYFKEAGTSSLRYAADLHLGKAYTDVVIQGYAMAPQGHSVSSMMVDIDVNQRPMKIAVFGHRVWRNGAISQPEPFEKMPLVYENAYGGKCLRSAQQGIEDAYELNPVGKGYVGEKVDPEGTPLPNLESVDQLIRQPGDRPQPMSPGFIAPVWMPRRSFAGTYDEQWAQNRAPDYPDDFDRRFNNASHPLFMQDTHFTGGETIAIKGMSEQPIQISVPRCPLWVQVSGQKGEQTLPVYCDTILIEPILNRCSIVWRSSVNLPIKAVSGMEVDYLQRRGQSS